VLGYVSKYLTPHSALEWFLHSAAFNTTARDRAMVGVVNLPSKVRVDLLGARPT